MSTKVRDEDTVRETAIECALRIRFAHQMITNTVSELRHLKEHECEFDELLELPRILSKAEQKMVGIYRSHRGK